MSPPKAINGITDPSKARLVFWGGTEYQHAPADSVGYQPLDAELTDIAGLTPAAGAVMIGNGSNWTADTTPTLTGLLTVNGQIAFPATQNPSADVNTLDDFEENTFASVASSSVGTLTSASCGVSYQKIGKWVHGLFEFQIVTVGTGAGELQFTLPFTAAAAYGGLCGREIAVAGWGLTGYVASGTNLALFAKYDGTTAAASGHTFVGSFLYQATA